MDTLDEMSMGQIDVSDIALGSLPDFAPNCTWSTDDSNVGTTGRVYSVVWWNNTVYKLLLFGAAIAIYKTVMNRPSMQKSIHNFGRSDKPYMRHLCWLLQWYTLFALLFVFLFVVNTIEILILTFGGGEGGPVAQQLLDSKQDDTFWKIALYISWGGPMIAANLGLVLCLYHCVKHMREGAHKKIREGPERAPFPWQSSAISEMIMVTVTLPLVMILMASKSTIRMWLKLAAKNYGERACYDEVWYSINLQVVNIYGYLVIFVFTDLISSILKKRIGVNVRFAVQMTSFQGTWAFVIVGVVQGLLEVLYAFAILNKEKIGPESNMAVIMQARAQLKTLSTVFMILCIYNMVILCKVPIVKEALGNASLKFLATRSILLIIQYQPVILAFLSEPKKFVRTFPNKKVHALEEEGVVDVIMGGMEKFKLLFGQTKEDREATARLYNACFLCWEGFVMIIFNLYAWGKNPEDFIRSCEEFGIDQAKPSLADKLVQRMSGEDEDDRRQKSLQHKTTCPDLSRPML